MAENTPGQVFGPGTPPTDQPQVTDSSAATSPVQPSRPEQPDTSPEIVQPTHMQPVVGQESVEAPAQPVVVDASQQPQPPEQDGQTTTVSTPGTAIDTKDTEPRQYVEVDQADNPYDLPNDEPFEVTSLEPISWTASEYIAHHKSPMWYGGFVLTVLAIAAVVFFVTGRDILSTVAVALVAVVFAIYAARPPRVQEYMLSESGVSIGAKTYSFHEIKSFSLIEEGPFVSISFLPMKRFMPMLSIYFDPADEDRIVAFLTNYLPIEHRKKDLIDRIMRKIKF